MSFRIAELTQLLAYCGQSRLGRKSILQARALDLLKGDNLTHKVQFKIRELGLLQNSSSAANKSTALETPLIQDSSSNECTITGKFKFNLIFWQNKLMLNLFLKRARYVTYNWFQFN